MNTVLMDVKNATPEFEEADRVLRLVSQDFSDDEWDAFIGQEPMKPWSLVVHRAYEGRSPVGVVLPIGAYGVVRPDDRPEFTELNGSTVWGDIPVLWPELNAITWVRPNRLRARRGGDASMEVALA